MQQKLLIAIGLCTVVAAVALAAVLFGGLPHAGPAGGDTTDRYVPPPANCSGDYFAFISKNFTDPVTPAEINATEERIIGRFVNNGGTRPSPGSNPDLPKDARIVAFGYYIDAGGTPHAFFGVAGKAEMEPYALYNSGLWYQDTIADNATFTNKTCSR